MTNPEVGEWARWGIAILLGWVTTVGTWIVINIFRLKNRLGRVMTFRDHAQICDKKNERIGADIAQLRSELAAMEQRQDRARADLSEKVETNRTESREDFQRVFEKIDDVADAIRSSTGTWPTTSRR